MGESKDYMTLPEQNGSVNIAKDGIAAVAVDAVREVEGVSGMMTSMGGVMDLVDKKNAQKGLKGVRISVSEENQLTLDLYLTVNYGVSIPETAENAQKAVATAVEDMTGCKVSAVNVHVGGVSIA